MEFIVYATFNGMGVVVMLASLGFPTKIFSECSNWQLERQLNAIYNKEEEERIRREEAAKEDG